MLPLKILKKQQAFNLISACMKQSKDLQHQTHLLQSSCQESDHPVGPISAISSYWRHRFEIEGIPEPIESIEHIIAHVIGGSKEIESHEKEFDEKQLQKLKMLCNRRLTKMPLEYVTGEGEFKNTKLKLAPPIFIPEPQTEILVDLLLKHIARSSSVICTVLEIGCGAGAISLSLLRSCNSVQVMAIDTNIIACELTLHNAKNLGVENRLTLLHATLEENGEIITSANLSDDRRINLQAECFDFIVSNPPCTPLHEIPKWQKEFEDIDARNGGEDGLKIIRPLLLYASRALNDNGVLLLEVFPTQPKKIKDITEHQYSSTLRFDHVYKDLGNDERIVEITKIG